VLSARAFLARALWLQGFLDKAYSEAQASVDEVRATDHQLLLCRVLYLGICRIAPSTGNFAAAEQSVARLTETATSLNAPFWQTAGLLLSGKLMIERGEFAQGMSALRDALSTCRRTGWRMSYPEFNATLASGLAGLGKLDKAVAAVNEGLAAADRGEDGHDLYLAEALRIKGEIRQRIVSVKRSTSPGNNRRYSGSSGLPSALHACALPSDARSRRGSFWRPSIIASPRASRRQTCELQERCLIRYDNRCRRRVAGLRPSIVGAPSEG